MSESLPVLKRYNAPPIVERIATVRAQVDPQLYEERMSSWTDLVATDFPEDTSIAEWKLNMKHTDEGIPLVDTMSPELVITPRFSRLKEKGKFDWSLRCPPDRLTMNMHSMPRDGRGYLNLREDYSKWLHAWSSHFEVKELDSVVLNYSNMLHPAVTPQLFKSDGGLGLGDTLTIFSIVPGEHEYLEPPFDCQIGVCLNGKEDAHLRIRVNDASGDSGGVAVKVSFTATAQVNSSKSVDDALNLLDWCHERIVERFEVVFTDEAKESFEPIEE